MAISLNDLSKKQMQKKKTPHATQVKPKAGARTRSHVAERPWQNKKITHDFETKGQSSSTANFRFDHVKSIEIEETFAAPTDLQLLIEKFQQTLEEFVQKKWLEAQRRSYFLSKLTFAGSPIRKVFSEIKDNLRRLN